MMADMTPPALLNAWGKSNKPAPKAALTTRNTEAYQDDPVLQIKGVNVSL